MRPLLGHLRLRRGLQEALLPPVVILAQAEDAVGFWDLTNREDWRIAELSQAGIRSRAYTPGPYSAREELLHAFDQTVLEREREWETTRGAGRRPR